MGGSVVSVQIWHTNRKHIFGVITDLTQFQFSLNRYRVLLIFQSRPRSHLLQIVNPRYFDLQTPPSTNGHTLAIFFKIDIRFKRGIIIQNAGFHRLTHRGRSCRIHIVAHLGILYVSCNTYSRVPCISIMKKHF